MKYTGRRCVLSLLIFLTCAVSSPIDRREVERRAATEVETDETHYLADRLWKDLALGRFYDSISKLRFCFDFDSPLEMLQLLRNALPAEELVETSTVRGNTSMAQQDEICGNWDRMVDYMCDDEEDFILYFQVNRQKCEIQSEKCVSVCVANR